MTKTKALALSGETSSYRGKCIVCSGDLTLLEPIKGEPILFCGDSVDDDNSPHFSITKDDFEKTWEKHEKDAGGDVSKFDAEALFMDLKNKAIVIKE